MPDIAKCTGGDCPIKNKCYRFTLKPNEFRQSYFVSLPFKKVGDKVSCEMYWGENSQSIWNQLNEILKGNG